MIMIIDEEVEGIVAMMLEMSLPRFVPDVDLSLPVTSLSDDVLVVATRLRLIPEQSERHSSLFYRQQNSSLTTSEKIELNTLNRVYELGLVYQSQALAEAVQRGLIKELSGEQTNQ